MVKAYETKKYGTDKIALLGFFVVTLLIAYFIVISRFAIVLSGPIKLGYAGLSVSMPNGNGWQSEEQWSYQKNGFTLSSMFAASSARPTAHAFCRYLSGASREYSPHERFAKKSSQVEGVISKTDQIHTETLTIDWAHIEKPDTPFSLFFGIARLPNGSQLDIEVYQFTGDTSWARQVFDRIVESLQFEDNQLLKTGGEIVEEVRNKGIDYFLDDQSREDFFLIKDAKGRAIGFTMEVMISSAPDANASIQAASLSYIPGPLGRERATFFESPNNFDQFSYKSETRRITGSSGVRVAVDKAGIMTIEKSGTEPEEENYQISPAAIPEIFFAQLLNQIIVSGRKEIIVDIIEDNGKITPMHIARLETQDNAADKETPYVLKLDFLDGRRFSELVYLDDKKQIVKRLLQQENTYILERVSKEDIAGKFPERAGYILRKNKMLEQNRL